MNRPAPTSSTAPAGSSADPTSPDGLPQGPPQSPPGRPGGSSRFRADVEGLRAVAVLVVLLYHAGVPWMSGGFIGVDVFFVVSGFVITNQLLREVEATGRVSLWGFYGRRAKRLLPAAGLVLVVTAVMAWLLTSRVRWESIAGDIAAAAVYVVNWVFAGRSVDYLAQDTEPSPVLHYWSLSVEEQFYLLWPLLILALVLLARWWQRRRPSTAPPALRRSLAAGLVVVVVLPSLACSLVYTAVAPAQAFFLTPTRLWELGIGGLVALGAGTFRGWRQRTGALVAWAGLALLISSVFLVTDRTPWPGAAALGPVLGTAAVIAGGFSCRRMGVAGLLGQRPMVWVGGLSYSLYLWHWPLLRFWEWQVGDLTVWQGLVIGAFSFLPAWLSYRFVESPIRHARALNISPRYALSVGVNASLVALVAALVLAQGATLGPAAGGRATGASWGTSSTPAPGVTESPRSSGTAPDAAPQPTSPGGGDPLPLPSQEKPGDEPFFDEITPAPVAATSDLPQLYSEDCFSTVADVVVKMCERGDAQGQTVVAVVGDSKVGQWLPALQQIAAERGWLLRVYTKNGCAFTAATTVLRESGEPFDSCRAWGQEVIDRLTGAEQPDAVITSALASRARGADGELTEQALVEGYLRYWRRLAEVGVPVLAISDTPQPRSGPPSYECVAEHPEELDTCSWPSDDGHGSTALQQAAEQLDTAEYIDMNPWVCPEGVCAAVYRNVLTYRQGSHLTATFAEVLAEPLTSYLVPLIEAAPGQAEAAASRR